MCLVGTCTDHMMSTWRWNKVVISEETEQARHSSFRYLPQQVSCLYLEFCSICTPKVQLLTGNREKQLENARLA